MRRGNCYVTSEALYHLLGGKAAGWKAMVMRTETDNHWFLVNEISGQRIDATASQFKTPPDYSKARGIGFMTKEPSARAKALMAKLVFQET